MKTDISKPAAPRPAAQARFLEVRAGRLRSEADDKAYSERLSQARRYKTAPTD
jgi:hypothetical protein